MRASRLALETLFAFLFAFALEARVPTSAQAKKSGSPAVKSTEELGNLKALNLRVMNLYRSGSYREAGRAAEELVVAARERYGDKDPAYAEALLLQGLMFRHQARYDDAEPLMRRALEIYESTSKPDDASVASTLLGLGQVLWHTHRLADAEAVLHRALAIQEKTFGPDHLKLSPTLNSLAIVQRLNKKPAEAEVSLRRALAIQEKRTGPDNSTVAVRLTNLASLLISMNRSAEAEALLHRALSITEKALGPDHPHMANRLATMARLMHLTNRAVKAEPLMDRVVSIYEKNFGPNHIQVANALFGLAVLRAERGDWPGAVELGRRAISIVTSHGQDVFARERDRVDGDEDEATDRPHVDSSRVADKTNAFRTHTRALYRSGPDDRRAQEEGFEAAQWALQTDAAHALAQMSARFALGSTTLAAIVREQQDLIARRQAEDSRLLAAIGRGDTHLTEQSRATLSEISAKLSSIDIRLGTEFPQYADLSVPKPLSIADTQLLLAPDEALMLFLDIPRRYSLPEESLGFLVTRETFRWFRIPIGPRALGSQVAALRCGLDETLWLDATDWPQATEEQLRQRTAQIAHRKRCEALLKATPRAEVSGLGANQVLPFDLERANKLYQALFGKIEELIKNKHLLMVPAGPLTALPFHVLITQKPTTPLPTQSDGYGDAAWLAKSNAITVLPSVASLKAVRSIAKTSKATSSFIGFGDPLLVGPSGTDKRAWTRQNCTPSGSAPLQIAARSSPGPIPNFFRGRLADVQLIRHQYPLPETADELCAVAHAIGAPESSVFLGEKATETIIKNLSASGKLSDVHVVHFATHGLLASESSLVGSSVAEPALLLTPPAVPTEADDGLLTASEVAQLKLDADWVVLSACNTAAGETDKPDAQALSGLARAFFYAGARALLVSHWAVDSQATVSLITRAFDEITSDNVGRAEAVRRSMMALVSTGGRNAHPAQWGPFVVVGEGAR